MELEEAKNVAANESERNEHNCDRQETRATTLKREEDSPSGCRRYISSQKMKIRFTPCVPISSSISIWLKQETQRGNSSLCTSGLSLAEERFVSR